MMNVTVGSPVTGGHTYELPAVGQWLVVQQRLDSSESFDQQWFSYVNGLKLSLYMRPLTDSKKFRNTINGMDLRMFFSRIFHGQRFSCSHYTERITECCRPSDHTTVWKVSGQLDSLTRRYYHVLPRCSKIDLIRKAGHKPLVDPGVKISEAYYPNVTRVSASISGSQVSSLSFGRTVPSAQSTWDGQLSWMRKLLHSLRQICGSWTAEAGSLQNLGHNLATSLRDKSAGRNDLRQQLIDMWVGILSQLTMPLTSNADVSGPKFEPDEDSLNNSLWQSINQSIKSNLFVT